MRGKIDIRKIDLEKMKADLLKRTKLSYETRDLGSTFKSYFKSGLDIPFWDCKEGEHLIDIIPYMAGPNNPHSEPGTFTYLLDIWVHYNVGVNEDQYICLAKTYGKPCPVCEYLSRMRRSPEFDSEEFSSLKARRRVIYNIVCYDDPREQSKGVQVWEVAHYFMERHLSELSKTPKGEHIPFSNVGLEGKSIYFRKKGRGAGNVEFVGHRFVDREEPVELELLEQVYCLDELIYIPTYEEVEEALYGSRKKVERDKEKFEETERKRYEYEAESEVEPEPEELEPEEPEPEPKPEPKPRPRLAPRAKPKRIECPAGGKFGVDFEEFDECESCDFYAECEEEWRQRRRARRQR